MEPLLSNPLEPGTIIDRYRIIGRLAVGGMAELYLADARGIEGFEKRLVLKRIHPQHLGKPEYVSMFLDEARIAATLHHPNIAQVYDIGNDGGTYFFTMEHVDGRDVRHIWQEAYNREENIPLEHTINICVGVLAGLHAAHEKRASDGVPLGIVHRDVSPTNVIVTWEGNVKLIDFGIAKAKRRQTMTRNGAVKGKSCSMSPEQARGKEIDRRSDIFSLGIMLWELSVGEPLFVGEGDYETLRKIVDGEIDLPSSRLAGFDPALERIVMKALAHSPDDRYQTAQDMLIALDDYARDHDMVLAPYKLSQYLARLFPQRGQTHDDAASPPLFLVESGSELELPDPSESLDVTLDADIDDSREAKERAPTTSVLAEDSLDDVLPEPTKEEKRPLHLDQLTLPRRQVTPSAQDIAVAEEPPPPPPRSRSLTVAIAVGAALITLGGAVVATLLSSADEPETEDVETASEPETEPPPQPDPQPDPRPEPAAALPTPAAAPAAPAPETGDTAKESEAEPPEEILAIDDDDDEEAARQRRREERRKRRRAERRARREAERKAREAAAAEAGDEAGDGGETARDGSRAKPDEPADSGDDNGDASTKAKSEKKKKKSDASASEPAPAPAPAPEPESASEPAPESAPAPAPAPDTE